MPSSIASIFPSTKGSQVTSTFGQANNLGSGVGSTYEVPLQDGWAGIALYLGCPTGGTAAFEGTYDDQHWFSATVRDVTDGFVTQSTGGASYIGSVAGMRGFRVRMIAPGTGLGTVMGTTQRFQHTLDGIDSGPASDFFLNIAENKVAGYSVVNKFGRNRDVSANTPTAISSDGGTYAGFPTGISARIRVYSSATGDSTNGFGARAINVIGLDANFAIQNEQLPLSGTAYVTGQKTFSRIHTASITAAGSNGYNLGQISCEHIPPYQANVFFRMYTGTNQTNESAYTVPAGKTAYIRDIQGTLNHIVGTQTNQIREANMCLLIRAFGGVFRQRRPVGLSTYRTVDQVIEGGLAVSEKSDIILQAQDASDTVDISAGYDLILVDNTI